jgi:hypothetical protein
VHRVTHCREPPRCRCFPAAPDSRERPAGGSSLAQPVSLPLQVIQLQSGREVVSTLFHVFITWQGDGRKGVQSTIHAVAGDAFELIKRRAEHLRPSP